MTGTRSVLGLLAAGGLALALALPAAGSDERLYYVVEGDGVVFTNTPSRADARSVPGLAPPIGLSSAALPVTPFDPYIEQVARETAGWYQGMYQGMNGLPPGISPEDLEYFGYPPWEGIP